MPESRRPRPATVLVVDDEHTVRELIRVNLELEGFRVALARDGAECLEAVHRVAPDVITLDSAMPGIDGAQTAERLRDDPRTRPIPLLMVSAASGPTGPVDARLGKPFEPACLVRLVRELADGAARRGETPPAPIPVHGLLSHTLAP